VLISHETFAKDVFNKEDLRHPPYDKKKLHALMEESKNEKYPNAFDIRFVDMELENVVYFFSILLQENFILPPKIHNLKITIKTSPPGCLFTEQIIRSVFCTLLETNNLALTSNDSKIIPKPNLLSSKTHVDPEGRLSFYLWKFDYIYADFAAKVLYDLRGSDDIIVITIPHMLYHKPSILLLHAPPKWMEENLWYISRVLDTTRKSPENL
jgi:hypothetical protein